MRLAGPGWAEILALEDPTLFLPPALASRGRLDETRDCLRLVLLVRNRPWSLSRGTWAGFHLRSYQ